MSWTRGWSGCRRAASGVPSRGRRRRAREWFDGVRRVVQPASWWVPSFLFLFFNDLFSWNLVVLFDLLKVQLLAGDRKTAQRCLLFARIKRPNSCCCCNILTQCNVSLCGGTHVKPAIIWSFTECICSTGWFPPFDPPQL